MGACERGGYDFREGLREVRLLGEPGVLRSFESLEVVRTNDSVTRRAPCQISAYDVTGAIMQQILMCDILNSIPTSDLDLLQLSRIVPAYALNDNRAPCLHFVFRSFYSCSVMTVLAVMLLSFFSGRSLRTIPL